MELQAAVGVVRRRWWVLVLGVLIGLATSLGITANTTEEYQASSRLFVSIPPAANVQEAVQGFQLSQQLLASYARMANSQAAVLLIRRETEGRIPGARIARAISAQTVPQTVLIEIKARDRDPVIATELANEAANALTVLISRTQVSATKTVEANIIDRALPPRHPITPNGFRNLQVGGFVGLVLGAAAALLIDALDRTIRTSAEAANAFNAPLLCSIPNQRRLSSDPLVALKSEGSPTGEAFRALRTAVRFRDAAHPLRTVLVTSGAAGDGKSTIAANLAIAMSLDGARVILIDADLRRTTLAKVFGLKEGPGLTNILMGNARLADVLVPWSRGMSVLQVGTHSLNPSEALGSKAMVDVLNEAKQMADIVIVDAPPVLPVADPAVLAALVDGTVIVSRWGKTSFHSAEATRQMLENVGANVIGVVFNAEGGGRSANYYRHYSARPRHRRGYANGNGAASREVPEPSATPPDGS